MLRIVSVRVECLHLDEKMRLAIRKTEMWVLTHESLFVERVMPRKAFSVPGRRKQWNDKWKVSLCREVWIGAEPSGS